MARSRGVRVVVLSALLGLCLLAGSVSVQAVCLALAGPGFSAMSFFGYDNDATDKTGLLQPDSTLVWPVDILGPGSFSSIIELAVSPDLDRVFGLDSASNQVLLYAPREASPVSTLPSGSASGMPGIVFYSNPNPDQRITHVSVARSTFAVTWADRAASDSAVLGVFSRETGEPIRNVVLDTVDLRNFNALQAVDDSRYVLADSSQPVLGMYDSSIDRFTVLRLLGPGRHATAMAYDEVTGTLFAADSSGKLTTTGIKTGEEGEVSLPSSIQGIVTHMHYLGNNELSLSGPNQALITMNIKSLQVTKSTISDTINAIHCPLKCPGGNVHGFGYTLDTSSTAFRERASILAYQASVRSGTESNSSNTTIIIVVVVVIAVLVAVAIGTVIAMTANKKKNGAKNVKLGAGDLRTSGSSPDNSASDAYLVRPHPSDIALDIGVTPETSNTPSLAYNSLDTKQMSSIDMTRNSRGSNQSNSAHSSSTISASRKSNVDYRKLPLSEIELGSRIGHGGFAQVYRGSWNGLDVAVKVMNHTNGRNVVELFEKEMSVLSKLRHPNIVLLLGADISSDGHVTIVTELKEDGSLLDMLDKYRMGETGLPAGKAWRIALDVALGMLYLHSDNPPIVHRDLKSANILMDGHGRASVADFGLSRVYGDVNVSNAPVGTPAWMAPELVAMYTERSAVPPGEHTLMKMDVYSYGVVLWEIATLLLPWDDLSLETLFRALASSPKTTRLQVPDWVPEAWATLIGKCFAPTPLERPFFRDIVRYLKENEAAMSVAIPRGPPVPLSLPGATDGSPGSRATDVRVSLKTTSGPGSVGMSRSAVTVADLKTFLANMLGSAPGGHGQGAGRASLAPGSAGALLSRVHAPEGQGATQVDTLAGE